MRSSFNPNQDTQTHEGDKPTEDTPCTLAYQFIPTLLHYLINSGFVYALYEVPPHLYAHVDIFYWLCPIPTPAHYLFGNTEVMLVHI